MVTRVTGELSPKRSTYRAPMVAIPKSQREPSGRRVLGGRRNVCTIRARKVEGFDEFRWLIGHPKWNVNARNFIRRWLKMPELVIKEYMRS